MGANTFLLDRRPDVRRGGALRTGHAARSGIRVETGKTTQTIKHRHGELMAVVTRDALGRLWTDLTWHGALFVGERAADGSVLSKSVAGCSRRHAILQDAKDAVAPRAAITPTNGYSESNQ